MATRACIERIRALPIKGSEIEIHKSELNGDGMTEIGYYEMRVTDSNLSLEASMTINDPIKIKLMG